jgi:hypothetical protein
MKILVSIFLILMMLSACGGGGGNGGAGVETDPPVTVDPDPPITFTTDQIVLDEKTFQVEINGEMRNLAAPTWVNNRTSGTDGVVEYVAARDQGYVVVSGFADGVPFAEVVGTLEFITGPNDITYAGKIDVVSGSATLSAHIDLTLSLGWSFPRILGSLSAQQLDIYATMDDTGLLNGQVGYNGAYADLKGGVFSTSTDRDGELLGAAFAGTTFYGVLTGTRKY